MICKNMNIRHQFEPVVEALESLCLDFSVILLLRGVHVHMGVVYTGNNVIFTSEMFPPWTQTGKWTVRSRSNFDDDSDSPVPYLQVL